MSMHDYKRADKIVSMLNTCCNLYSEKQTVEEIDFSIPVFVIEVKYNDEYYVVERNNIKKNPPICKIIKYMEKLNKESKKIVS